MKTAALLSAEDFAVVAPLLGPCELVKGEIISMSPAGVRHSEVVARATVLATHNRDKRLGRVLSGEAGIIVARGPDTVRGADVAFISYRRLPRDMTATDSFVEAAPELVIEVFGSDTSWEKMDAKVTEYHAHGVDLVWVLDPHTLTLRAYPRGGSPSVLRDTDIADADPAMPGLSVRVAEFFED